jgi:hypothetical protein
MPQTDSQGDSYVIRWTAVETLPAENGLPAVIIPEPNQGTPQFEEYSLLVRCIRGSEQSWFANLGKSIFVGTLRWQRGHLARPSLASGTVYILGKYIQKAVLLTYRIYLSLYPSKVASGHISAVNPAAIAGVTRKDECTRQKL